MPHITFTFIPVVVLIVLTGCSSRGYQPSPEKPSNPSLVASPTVSSATQLKRTSVLSAEENQNASDQERLALLWQKRTQKNSTADYPIGPGDLLEVDIAGVEELKDRTVRVSGEGTITLPFVGIIQASGLTEEELR